MYNFVCPCVEKKKTQNKLKPVYRILVFFPITCNYTTNYCSISTSIVLYDDIWCTMLYIGDSYPIF